MEKVKKSQTLIRPYSSNNYSKLSTELFNKLYRTKLGVYGQKLLFGLASSLSNDVDLFPVWDIPISGLFKYLNLSDNNNDRYRIVRDTIKEIAGSTLEFEVSDKKWRYLNWFNEANFDSTDSEYVRIEFSPKVKPYLLQLKEYCLLEAKYYIDLSSDYSIWLYPLLRNVANKSTPCLELSIEEIKKLTFNESTAAYNPQKNKSANKDLLKWVVGIEKKRGAMTYTPRTIKKNGVDVETGTIAEINQKTDLYVTCDIKKNGRSLSHVIFNVHFKGNTFQGKRKAIKRTHRTQFEDSETYIKKIEEIKTNDLFETAVPIQEVEGYAKSAGLTLKDFLKKAGYKQVGNRAIKIVI